MDKRNNKTYDRDAEKEPPRARSKRERSSLVSTHRLDVQVVLLSPGLRELGQPLLDGGGEAGVFRLELGVLGRDRGVALLEEGASMLRRDGCGVGPRPHRLQLAVQVADKLVCPLCHLCGVMAAELELLVREEERHGGRWPRHR